MTHCHATPKLRKFPQNFDEIYEIKNNKLRKKELINGPQQRTRVKKRGPEKSRVAGKHDNTS